MKKKLFLLLTVLTIISNSQILAQKHDTHGTNFWVTAMWNVDTTQGDNSFGIFTTGTRSCTVSLENPSTGWTASMLLTPNTVNQIAIPLSQAFHYDYLSGTIQSKGIHVTSTDTISLFSITQGYPNMDIATILPIEMLGSNYMVQAIPSDRYPTEFAIIAAEDNITIDITPTCQISGGYSAGSTHTITLAHAGQSIQFLGSNNADITGTRISARDGKKIAVFNGDACVYVPSYNNCPTCDQVYEQAVPIEQWGSKFVAHGSQRPNNKVDRVRITSLDNNCTVHINGMLAATLNSGQSYLHTMSSNIEVDYIETSGPAIANQYLPSMNSSGFMGDPSMITLAPLDQGVLSASYIAPSNTLGRSDLSTHALVIVTPTSNISNILLDNQYISPQFAPVGYSSGYSCFFSLTSSGYHTIQSISDTPFISYCFGFGTRVSYGFVVGLSGNMLLKPSVLINHHTDSTETICEHDSIYLSVDTNNNHIHQIIYTIDEESLTDSVIPFIHSFPSPGTYHLCVNISYSPDNDLTQLIHDTVCKTIIVNADSFSESYDSICSNQLPYYFNGYPLTIDSDITTHSTNPETSCPSTEVFHLTINNASDTYLDTVVCSSALPLIWDGFTFQEEGLRDLNLQTQQGCDSTIHYSLHTKDCGCNDSNAIWAPNIFIPSQTTNNTFKVLTHEVIEATMVIYHRWGMYVTTLDPLTQQWDGTKDGQPCPEDAYVYKITYRTQCNPNSIQTKLGTVTLIR